MLEKISQTLAEHDVFAQSEPVLIAVSGGVDSVVLLHVLDQLKDKWGLRLHVVNVEHGLRGVESEEDAHFVRQYAEELGIPFYSESFDVRSYAGEHKLSTQVAAREVRYRYFAQVAREVGATKVVTAHHADDQAETVLMRVVRGTSLRGLAGIPMRRQEQGYELVRPMLDIWREEIEKYARQHDLPYREDSSNASTKYLRNKIRIRLLPQLVAEYNSGVKQALNQLAQQAREDDTYLSELAQEAFQCIIEQKRGFIQAKVTHLREIALPLQRRVITLILYYLRGHTIQWEQVHVQSVQALINCVSPSAATSLPDGIVAWREYEDLYIGEASARRTSATDSPREACELSVPGEVLLPAYGIALELQLFEGVPPRPQDAWEAQFDADELSSSRIYIRTWATGDTFRPLGLNGTKLISDALIDAKIPRHQRDHWPLFCIDDQIAWIVGVRRGQQAKVTPTTARTLILRATPHTTLDTE